MGKAEGFFTASLDRTPYGSCGLVAVIAFVLFLGGAIALWHLADFTKHHRFHFPSLPSQNKLQKASQSSAEQLQQQVQDKVNQASQSAVNQAQQSLKDQANQQLQEQQKQLQSQSQKQLQNYLSP